MDVNATAAYAQSPIALEEVPMSIAAGRAPGVSARTGPSDDGPPIRVAVVGRNPDRAAARAAIYGVSSYVDIDEMLDRERPDLVSLCLRRSCSNVSTRTKSSLTPAGAAAVSSS
jgi:hypothetical protein